VLAMGEGSTSRRSLLVLCLVLAVLSSLLVVRARHGIEWFGDEAYALDTPMRYIAGDRPIIDSWESHFSSAMLLTPFVGILEKSAPNREGIVLHFRYLFIALQALYAACVWLLLRRLSGTWWAIAIAGTVFLYLPFFYVFPYYNNIAVATFTISTLLVLRGFSGSTSHRGRFLVGGGIMSAVGAISYPPMVIALPLFLLGIVLESRAQHDQGSDVWRAVRMYSIGAFAALSVFLAITLVSSGWQHLAQALPNFTDPVDRDLSLGAIAIAFQKTASVMIAPVAAAIAFLLYAFVRGRKRASAVTAIALTIATSVVTAAALYRLHVSWLHFFDMPEAVAFGVGTAVLLLPMLTRRPPSTYRYLRLLCLPTLGLWVGTMLGSHEGFETATMPTVILMIAAILALIEAFDIERQSSDSNLSPSAMPTVLATGSMALLIAFFLYASTQYVAGDAAVRQLDALIDSGPYKGISTTRANVEQYENYMKVLGPMQSEPGRIAFVEEFPLGYLLSGRRPGTYSVWTTYARGNRWQRYLDLTGNYPQTIVATRVWGYGSASDAEKVNAVTVPPPFGLTEFTKKYVERYEDANFIVYERR